jgi:hypothetical protein
MPSPCKLCRYEDKLQIERDILSGRLKQVDAAKLVGCNKSSITRHMQNHVGKQVARVAEHFELKEGLNAIDALTESHERVLSIFNEAVNAGNRREALLAINAETKQLELMAKITGQTSAPAQVNFLIHPQFVKLKTMMVQKLTPFPEARVALSEAFEEMAQEAEQSEQLEEIKNDDANE